MASLEFQVLLLWESIRFQPEEVLRGGQGIGVWTRRTGKVGERAGDGGRGLQIETGVGPGSTGDSPVPSGDSPDGTTAWFSSIKKADCDVAHVAVPVGGSPTGAGESPALPILKTGCTVWCPRFSVFERDGHPEGWTPNRQPAESFAACFGIVFIRIIPLSAGRIVAGG